MLFLISGGRLKKELVIELPEGRVFTSRLAIEHGEQVSCCSAAEIRGSTEGISDLSDSGLARSIIDEVCGRSRSE